MLFTWNREKAEKFKSEHKVDFEKLQDIFDDPFAIEFTDEEHSTEEEIGFAVIGLTADYGLVYLVLLKPPKLSYISSQLEKLKIGW